MNITGPIVIIEDDKDDRYLLSVALKELECSNEIRFFDNGNDALAYLSDDKVYPFLILSDVNMPKFNGFELIDMVRTNEALSQRCIPYLFFSTHLDQRLVSNAFQSSQGIFLKPDSYKHLLGTLRKIIAYWSSCYSPNRFLLEASSDNVEKVEGV